MDFHRETPWGYLAVHPSIKDRFDREAPRLDWATLEKELIDGLEEPLTILDRMLKLEQTENGEPPIDTFAVKQFYRYGFEGYPFFLNLIYNDPDPAGEAISTFLYYLDSCLHWNDLISAFQGHEGPESPGIIATINAVAARCRLDYYRLTGEEWGLSIQEVALLARMREVSVRNAATPKSKTPLKTKKTDDGLTVVDTAEAERWLLSRRNYVPTQLPNDDIGRKAMIAAVQEWV